MTDFRDRPDATDRWSAVIDALEALVLAAPGEPTVDPAEAEEVRRLILVRTARRKRDTLPAAWMRRPVFLHQVWPGEEAAPKMTTAEKPRPPSPERPAPAPPSWRE
jgi:hypothetical protein